MAPPTTDIVVREPRDVRAEDFLPVLSVKQAVERKAMMNEFISQVLHEDQDYGRMPGGRETKILLKPGAEKLCSIFGMAPNYVKEVIVEDWTGADHGGEPLFSYEYRCQLTRGGRFMGEAIGSCNSWESKYRYRWVAADSVSPNLVLEDLPQRGGVKTIFEPLFAIEKAETTGRYGKPAEYWAKFQEAREAGVPLVEKQLGQKTFKGISLTFNETQYRIPNPDIADVINTCQKMAQKRALVAAVLVVTNASDSFTQDVEDFEQVHVDHGPPIVDKQPVLPTTLPSGRAIPDEMQGMCAAVLADKLPVREAFLRMQDHMKKISPEMGGAEFRNIKEAYDAQYADGGKTKGNALECLLDMWNVATMMDTRGAEE